MDSSKDVTAGVSTAAQKFAVRVAVAAGVLPLLAGTGIFALGRYNGNDDLMTVGVLTLYAGVVLFLVCCLAVVRYLWLAWRLKNLSTARVFWAVVGSASLSLANFPVAGACILGAAHYETRYIVTVCNSSEQAMSQVCVYGAGADEFIGIIEPGETASVELWFDREGELKVFVSKAPGDENLLVKGYVCGGLGGGATVTMIPNGKLFVTYDER